jgi:hypothetical protein
MKKLFLLVRNDLDKGAQVVQTAHAVHGLSGKSQEFTTGGICNAVCFKVFNLQALTELAQKLENKQETKDSYCFHEPDRKNEMTAIAVYADHEAMVNITEGLYLL